MTTKIYVLVLLSLAFTTTYAQNSPENQVTEKKISKNKYPEFVFMDDIKKSEKGYYSIEKIVKMKNGKNQDVDVNFSVGFWEYEPTSDDLAKININTDQTLWLAKFSLKNQFSFEPFETSIYRNKNSWTIYLKYTAKNDYGIEKEGLKVYKYDLTGKQIK